MRVTLNGIVAADDDVEIYQWFGFAAFSPKAGVCGAFYHFD